MQIRAKDKFDGDIFKSMGWRSGVGLIYGEGGGGGGIIFGRKNTSICNMLKLLFFLFSSIKHIFRRFSRRARCEIYSKLTVKTPEYVKLMVKSKIKTSLMSFWPLYC